MVRHFFRSGPGMFISLFILMASVVALLYGNMPTSDVTLTILTDNQTNELGETTYENIDFSASSVPDPLSSYSYTVYDQAVQLYYRAHGGPALLYRVRIIIGDNDAIVRVERECYTPIIRCAVTETTISIFDRVLVTMSDGTNTVQFIIGVNEASLPWTVE